MTSALSEYARNLNLPAEVIVELTQKMFSNPASVNHLLLNAILKNPSTPPEVLQQIYETKTWAACYYLATHPNTPTNILLQLMNHEDDVIRERLFSSPDFHTKILSQAIEDGICDFNTKVPFEWLITMYSTNN